MKAVSRILLVLFVMGSAFLVDAQTVVESVEVTVIEVPVKVTDRSGAPIRGLTRENFEVFDNGKRRPIESFEMIDLAAPSIAAEPAATLHPAVYRNFLFLFDLTNSTPGSIERAREAAQGFVASDLEPRDLAAVATFSVEQGVRLLTSFTTDRSLLGSAIQTLGHPSYFRAADPLLISANVSVPEGGGGSAGGFRDGMGDVLNELVADANRLAEQGDDVYKRGRLHDQLRQFQDVARVMERLRGQKQIILLSEGFDARLVHGREDLGSTASREEAEAALTGEVWKIESDKRYGSSTSGKEIREMGEIFRRSDVVLHAFDIKGLRADVDAREGRQRSSNESLFLMSDPTGGSVFKNANDLSSSLQKMLDQQEVIYILTFRADPTSKPGTFHDLEVKTVGVRGARVQHRAGYYETTSEMSPLERAIVASEILFHDIPVDQLDVEMSATPFPNVKGSQIPIVLEIDGTRLLEAIDGDSATGDIFIYAFEPNGKVAGYLHQGVSLDLTRAGDLLRKAGIRYYGTLILEQGKDYSLKTLVRINENSRAGFESTSLHVPDFSEPVTSPPLFLAEQGDWIMLRSEARGGIDYPFVIGPRSFIPGVVPDLSGDQQYEIALFTYNVSPEQLKLAASLKSESGASVPVSLQVVGRTPEDEDGTVKYLFHFTPSNIAAGKYDLELRITPENLAEQMVRMPLVIN